MAYHQSPITKKMQTEEERHRVATSRYRDQVLLARRPRSQHGT
jgi:hypothetical protein